MPMSDPPVGRQPDHDGDGGGETLRRRLRLAEANIEALQDDLLSQEGLADRLGAALQASAQSQQELAQGATRAGARGQVNWMAGSGARREAPGRAGCSRRAGPPCRRSAWWSSASPSDGRRSRMDRHSLRGVDRPLRHGGRRDPARPAGPGGGDSRPAADFDHLPGVQLARGLSAPSHRFGARPALHQVGVVHRGRLLHAAPRGQGPRRVRRHRRADTGVPARDERAHFGLFQLRGRHGRGELALSHGSRRRAGRTCSRRLPCWRCTNVPRPPSSTATRTTSRRMEAGASRTSSPISTRSSFWARTTSRTCASSGPIWSSWSADFAKATRAARIGTSCSGYSSMCGPTRWCTCPMCSTTGGSTRSRRRRRCRPNRTWSMRRAGWSRST